MCTNSTGKKEIGAACCNLTRENQRSGLMAYLKNVSTLQDLMPQVSLLVVLQHEILLSKHQKVQGMYYLFLIWVSVFMWKSTVCFIITHERSKLAQPQAGHLFQGRQHIRMSHKWRKCRMDSILPALKVQCVIFLSIYWKKCNIRPIKMFYIYCGSSYMDVAVFLQ